MKGITKYTITCDKCGKSDELGITQNATIQYFSSDNIISARKRFDDEWGFECVCGQNTLTNDAERRHWKNKNIAPSPLELKNIIDNLKPEKVMFKLKERRA